MRWTSFGRGVLLTALVALGWVGNAEAKYPEKTITIVVPYSPGASNDISGRIIAERLTARLGVPVVVENKPGGGGLIGATYVVNAKPDGYTFLLTGNGVASVPTTENPPFDLEKDLVAVTQPTEGHLILVAGPDAPFKTIQEFVAYAKAHPDDLNGSTPGSLGASHLALEHARMELGFNYRPIHYPSNAPSQAAIMAGEVPFGIDSAPSVRGHIEAGRMIGLAVTNAERFPLLPDVPTISETVLPGFATGFSNMMFAPAGTPDEIVATFSALVNEVIREPEVMEKFAKVGMHPVGGTPQEFDAILKEEIERYKKIVADLRERGMLTK